MILELQKKRFSLTLSKMNKLTNKVKMNAIKEMEIIN